MTYFSKVAYTGNGTNTEFVVPFPYLEQDDVQATVNNAPVDLAWLNASTVKIDPAPANGTAIVIFRDTDIDAPKVDYTDGSTLSELDLDASHRQEVYKLQELLDELGDLKLQLQNVMVSAGNLPAVTGADNGKILRVVSGAWAVVAPLTISQVQTNSQVDGTSFKFQKKTRANVVVIASDAESAWTDEHTGTGCA